MKTLLSLIDGFMKQAEPEIQEAPRFEDWFHQMYPRDKFNPDMEEFGNTILQFKEDQKRKLTQTNGHSQSL